MLIFIYIYFKDHCTSKLTVTHLRLDVRRLECLNMGRAQVEPEALGDPMRTWPGELTNLSPIQHHSTDVTHNCGGKEIAHLCTPPDTKSNNIIAS